MKHKTYNKKRHLLFAEFQFLHFPFRKDGFVISIITFYVLIIMLSIALSIGAVIFYGQIISINSVKSTQSYYAAEAGAEDALLALSNNPSMAAKTYSFTVSSSAVNVTIPDIVAASRTIISQGNTNNAIRKLQVVYSVNSQGIAFHYGAQVGYGGLNMSSGSAVRGNVFSNGDVAGSGTIDNNVVVADSRKIGGLHIKGNASSYSCIGATIDGNLTYVTGGVNTCTAASTTTQTNSIGTQPLPISQNQIDNWKNEATNGGFIMANYIINGSQVVSLGPKKIIGNLTVSDSAILNITGTIYVTGDITISNNATVRLDSSSYGALGGVLLADGQISTSNNALLKGSGQTGSYLLLLSTNTVSAITISNNATGGIFYANAGTIQVSNNVQVKEITGDTIVLNNSAVIQYDSGLANAFFTSGPSAGWKVTSWGEQ